MILFLSLSLASGGLARAGEDHDFSPHASEFRRGRAEIIAGSIIMALSTVGAIVAIAIISTPCAGHNECDIIGELMATGIGVAALVEGAVGLPLFIHGLARRADAKVRFAPLAGPGTFGGGLRLSF